jgi:hypothetical protein
MVIALLALLFALGGSATAAGLITGKGIKNSSITGKDVKNKSLTKKDFKGSVRGKTGPQGPKGDTGAPGTPGSAVAYGSVTALGALSRSKNISSVTIVDGSAFCIDVAAPVQNVVASIDVLGSDGGAAVALAHVGSISSCPAGTDAVVKTFVNFGSSTSASPEAFMFAVN